MNMMYKLWCFGVYNHRLTLQLLSLWIFFHFLFLSLSSFVFCSRRNTTMANQQPHSGEKSKRTQNGLAPSWSREHPYQPPLKAQGPFRRGWIWCKIRRRRGMLSSEPSCHHLHEIFYACFQESPSWSRSVDFWHSLLEGEGGGGPWIFTRVSSNSPEPFLYNSTLIVHGLQALRRMEYIGPVRLVDTDSLFLCGNGQVINHTGD